MVSTFLPVKRFTIFIDAGSITEITESGNPVKIEIIETAGAYSLTTTTSSDMNVTSCGEYTVDVFKGSILVESGSGDFDTSGGSLTTSTTYHDEASYSFRHDTGDPNDYEGFDTRVGRYQLQVNVSYGLAVTANSSQTQHITSPGGGGGGAYSETTDKTTTVSNDAPYYFLDRADYTNDTVDGSFVESYSNTGSRANDTDTSRTDSSGTTPLSSQSETSANDTNRNSSGTYDEDTATGTTITSLDAAIDQTSNGSTPNWSDSTTNAATVTKPSGPASTSPRSRTKPAAFSPATT